MVLDVSGNRLLPDFVAHVDDQLYTDVKKYFPLALPTIVVSLNDSFGGSHMFQEDVLSDEKLRLIYKEMRTVLGNQPNTHTIMVKLSPRQGKRSLHLLNFTVGQQQSQQQLSKK